jgi:hypothetical protein
MAQRDLPGIASDQVPSQPHRGIKKNHDQHVAREGEGEKNRKEKEKDGYDYKPNPFVLAHKILAND